MRLEIPPPRRLFLCPNPRCEQILLTADPACPHCGSPHTQLTSEFGSTPCKALYKCLDCREPFDYFKCH